MKLPSKNKLPDYYDMIKKPLDIKKIFNRIEDGKVSWGEELGRNGKKGIRILTIWKRILLKCVYNEEASLIHEDSTVPQSTVDDEDGNSESESVRMKIKIKVGKGGRGGEGRGSTRRKKTQPKYTNSDDEDEDD
ncbi:conserved hypothetical protein [Pediculus humanus corporis]|uniref:Bromo domain-containing protein n=1 Tax=Pediculus humanus subsp. corporis TaxID=121224 RepID=E0W0U6_PEDHC|nr:uncharacterized protein Phum_PHUM563980 [Pediculus humanus corporis]EEB19252.1 conserved hypothetical protein [Pediculus humanus corporis]